jgi:hypothetical protein
MPAARFGMPATDFGMPAWYFGFSQKVAGMDRNHRPASSETGGRLPPKSPAGMVRNTHYTPT